MGPALATHAARRPLLEVIENSLGLIPAFALRVICALFLVLWIANLMVLPVWGWYSDTLRRTVSSTESGLFAAAVLAFLFVTGFQSLRTEAKLATFSNKLGTAILIAALVRVRAGWPAVLDFKSPYDFSWAAEVWSGLSQMAVYVAPLALLAADFGYHSRDRRQVAMTGLVGVAIPLFGSLLLVGVINAATHASPYYQPSLEPSIAMALWSHTARTALHGRMLIAALTIFGAVRFGARELGKIASIRTLTTRRGRIWLGCFVATAAWSCLHPFAPAFTTAFEFSGRCLGVAGAVLTGDFLTGRRSLEQISRIDWVGAFALLAGLATPVYLRYALLESTSDPWRYPLLLPSYVVALLTCVCGRTAQKRFVRARN